MMAHMEGKIMTNLQERLSEEVVVNEVNKVSVNKVDFNKVAEQFDSMVVSSAVSDEESNIELEDEARAFAYSSLGSRNVDVFAIDFKKSLDTTQFGEFFALFDTKSIGGSSEFGIYKFGGKSTLIERIEDSDNYRLLVTDELNKALGNLFDGEVVLELSATDSFRDLTFGYSTAFPCKLSIANKNGVVSFCEPRIIASEKNSQELKQVFTEIFNSPIIISKDIQSLNIYKAYKQAVAIFRL